MELIVDLFGQKLDRQDPRGMDLPNGLLKVDEQDYGIQPKQWGQIHLIYMLK